MTRQDFEDILTGPQHLTHENLELLLSFSRQENTIVEYKEDFNRENGKVVLIDFCKVLIGFLNSDNAGSVLIYGIDDAINRSSTEPVSQFIRGHNLQGTRKEDLVGYVRQRIWPADPSLLHIKQLLLSENRAVTTIFVSKGRSRPYLFYTPNKPIEGIRSFNRGAGVTYELEAPQLHQFISGIHEGKIEPSNKETNKQPHDDQDEFQKVISEHLQYFTPALKDPEEFGLYVIAVKPPSGTKIMDEAIKSILNPFRSDKTAVKVMEDLWYADPLEISQHWYRRRLIFSDLRAERKCNWAIGIYRGNGIMIVSGLVDAYMKGEKFISPYRFSYQIQRLLQMARVLYGEDIATATLFINFNYIERFGYVRYVYGNTGRIHPYTGTHEPIQKEINMKSIPSGVSSDALSEEVNTCMLEVARIFGLDSLPNQLTDDKGEMYYVQSFKGVR